MVTEPAKGADENRTVEYGGACIATQFVERVGDGPVRGIETRAVQACENLAALPREGRTCRGEPRLAQHATCDRGSRDEICHHIRTVLAISDRRGQYARHRYPRGAGEP